MSVISSSLRKEEEITLMINTFMKLNNDSLILTFRLE